MLIPATITPEELQQIAIGKACAAYRTQLDRLHTRAPLFGIVLLPEHKHALAAALATIVEDLLWRMEQESPAPSGDGPPMIGRRSCAVRFDETARDLLRAVQRLEQHSQQCAQNGAKGNKHAEP